MLICHTGTLDVEFNVNAVAIRISEEVTGSGDGSSKWVFGIVNTFSLGKSTCRELA
jgi:hypothetical protein